MALNRVNLAGGADLPGGDTLYAGFTKLNSNMDLLEVYVNAEMTTTGNLVYPYNYAQSYTYNGATEEINTISCTDGTTTWTQTFTYGVNGISSISCTDGTNTWVKTIGYDGSGRVSTESVWVPQ